MDGLLERFAKGMTATVVRQFVPSRIEHQLLAQVFEIVYDQESGRDESRWAAQSSVSTQAVRNDEQMIKGHVVAGRRAA